MTDEEKEAIEELIKKATISDYEVRDYPSMICFKKDVITILNLIEKQAKEIEALKNKESDYMTVYMTGVYDERKTWEQKNTR